jgi:hypothetical protein
MSAAPFNPEDIPKEAREGFVAGIIGAMAMTARLLLSEDRQTWAWVARRVCAASITAVMANYGLADYITSDSMRTAAVGGLAYASPEALDALLRAIKARANREADRIAGNPKPSKQNAKAPRKKRK